MPAASRIAVHHITVVLTDLIEGLVNCGQTRRPIIVGGVLLICGNARWNDGILARCFEKDMFRIPGTYFEPVGVIKAAGVDSDYVWKAFKTRVGLAAASSAEVDCDTLAAAL